MFASGMQEAQSNQIHFDNIDGATLDLIMNYVYFSKIQITDDNAASLIAASSILLLERLKNECEDYMIEIMTILSCLVYHELAQLYSLPKLEEAAKKLMLQRFTHVYKTEAFLELLVDQLISYLSDDKLTITNEANVFDAVVRWVQHREGERLQVVNKVMQYCRFAHCSTKFLSEIVHPHKYMLSNELRDHLVKATLFKLSPNQAQGLNYPWSKPRLGMFSKQRLLLQLEDGSMMSYKEGGEGLTLLTNLPTGTSHGLTMTVVDQGIIISGSPQAGQPKKFWQYMFADNKWSQLPDVPWQGKLIAHIAYKGHLYVWGTDINDQGVRFSSLASLNLSTRVWRECAAPSEVVMCPNMCVVRGRLYVYSGYCVPNRKRSPVTLSYDLIHDKWTRKADMPVNELQGGGTAPVRLTFTAVQDNFVFVHNRDGTFSFNVKENKWNRSNRMPGNPFSWNGRIGFFRFQPSYNTCELLKVDDAGKRYISFGQFTMTPGSRIVWITSADLP